MKQRNEHGGNIYKMARQSAGSAEYLDYSANINPLGLADSVRSAIINKIGSIIHYPDTEGFALKEAIAGHYGIAYETITLGNGAVELMYVLGHVLSPKRVLTAAPAFSEYERTAEICGAPIRYIQLDEDKGFRIDAEAAARELKAGDLMFLGNPNNPTGMMLRREEITIILKKAKACGAAVAVDESFIDFVKLSEQYTVRHLTAEYDNLIVLHSLTKFYAIPGLRLGFAVSCPQLRAKLEWGKDPWNVNSLAQEAGCAALRDDRYQEESRMLVNREKDHLYRALQSIEGLLPFPPSVNFMLVKITKDGLTAGQVRQLMAEREQILIRDCSAYEGLSERFIRVAIKSHEQNLKLIEGLKRVVGELI
ncbi:MAG: threonine-phosphate decarboxylase [Selenomonadales bacterium]|nr:threonine-phosphate decarboxylase [Selenomonadales bacterium]